MYLGVDVGSVSTNLVVLDGDALVHKSYLRTNGQPIKALKEGLACVVAELSTFRVDGVGVTGSGRRLAAVVLGADVIKNEITAHALAALHEVPSVKTIIEIGGQDSKLTVIRNSVVTDFAMNTVCAAGTGSFLDQQASRLSIPIDEFGRLALTASSPVRIAGRCAVFAESDMIHKQQMGHRLEDITAGLCQALVRNYLSNMAKGRNLEPPVVFQGGVAANRGMRRAFEEALGGPVIVPEHFDVMGAIGAALLARENQVRVGLPSAFRGFEALREEFEAGSFECTGCGNLCEVVDVKLSGRSVARWGDSCGRWQYEPATDLASVSAGAEPATG